MKKTILMAVLAAMNLMVSCSDDDSAKNGVQLQAHDENKMMNKMHTMMDAMAAMEMTHDPDVDFAAMMVMHHEGAIAMAGLELQEGSDTEMKAVAQAIVTAQQQEIQELETILAAINADEMDMDFMAEQMTGMDKMDAMADQQMITGDIDNDFASLMIIHHQAAIDSASTYLHHGSNPELIAMANMIIEAQSNEIIALSNWLAQNRR
ncbi:DUF305 domain-containing protein [Flavobacterium sp. MFBS3-15]|uniref:DUF305 domain-containing protein n=1 Tax=Flavobacterium sp. MFBS3-15 TaxID=2989816 RepID=UPI0022366F38|nr:DUF305 domain-containing protein [Flavobacterium sp. MFBS3-15]MCW4469794.1 DUF305 domain-containing protein [Flavobacterium sp. MFBS3-15]